MSTRVRGWAGLLAIVSVLSCFAGRASTFETLPAVESVWRQQQLSFRYQGYSTFYTCSALRHKLRSILTALGARDTIRVQGYACDDASGSARFNIVLESPVPATEENVRALTTFSTHQYLAARSRGETLPTAVDLERFPASWQTISLARAMRLEPGDCELVEQLRKTILPQLSVQIVSDDIRCSPFGNMRAPRLTVLALVAQRTEPL